MAKKSILPGEGIFEIFNQCIEGAGNAIGACINKAGKITEAVTAGVSCLVPSISDITSGLSFFAASNAPERLETAPKLGLNACKAQNYVVDTSPFACSFEDVVAPTVGGKAAQQSCGIQ